MPATSIHVANTCKNGALFMQKYPLHKIQHEIDQSDSESDHDGEETACQTSVSWYQWEEITNTLGYSNLGTVDKQTLSVKGGRVKKNLLGNVQFPDECLLF